MPSIPKVRLFQLPHLVQTTSALASPTSVQTLEWLKAEAIGRLPKERVLALSLLLPYIRDYLPLPSKRTLWN
ncbi:hypothetical protein LINPERPRIM_LOCUS2031 [Linum perenne]